MFYIIEAATGNHSIVYVDPPVFITHQLNAFEKNGKIYADMIIYKDASPYTSQGYINYILDPHQVQCVHRDVGQPNINTNIQPIRKYFLSFLLV